VAFGDDKSLTNLVRDLRAIANLLDGWRKAGAGEAPHLEVDHVARSFDNILRELRASGDGGEGLRKQLGAIANNLRSAADALHKQ